MEIKCPNCGQTCEVDEELAIGQYLLCPFCDMKFNYTPQNTTENDSYSIANTAETNVDAPTAKIQTTCPYCGTVYEVDADYIGETATCGTCDNPFVIKAAQETQSPDAPADAAAEKAAKTTFGATNGHIAATPGKKKRIKTIRTKAKMAVNAVKDTMVVPKQSGTWSNPMKPLVAIVCMMFAAFAFGAEKKAAPKKTSITESELRTMAKAKPNAKDAGTLYRVGMATNNVERKQEFFKASAACLLACGKIDTYRKYIKGKLANAEAFEDSLKDKCKQCDGAGRKEHRCYVCSGNGRCSTCKGSGQIVSVGFDRHTRTKPCHKCRGSGECNKCEGAGSTQAKCGSCAGTGKVFRESVAERVFRDTCIAIADRPAVEARAKAEAAERERKRIADSKKLDEQTARKAQEEFAKRCKGSGDAVQVAYKGIEYSKVGDNFVIFKQHYNTINWQIVSAGDVSLVVIRSPGHWYQVVESCVGKLKEWVRVAERNKVKDVTKEIPHEYDDVEGYSNKITEGRGQAELLRKAVRESYSDSSRVPEQIKFIGNVSASKDFKRFKVTLSMVCGDYFNSPLFYASGTIEKIDEEFIKFLVFANPASFEKALDEQMKKESLFR